jgi:hypothetical protein
VQVTLDPADLGRTAVDGLGPGLGQVVNPLSQLGLAGGREQGTGQCGVGAQQPGGDGHA